MTQPAILVVILNWRQPTLTIACVDAVQAMTGPPVDILLIDNGSGDDSADILAQTLPDIPLIKLPENLGFAGGCNVGLRQAIEQGRDYALLLNNDALPQEDMLTLLLAAAAEDVGLVGPKVLYHPERSYVSFGGGKQQRALLELRDKKKNQKDRPEWQETESVDYLWGTCWLVNLKAAEKVGLLDQRFFMYYEDLDWSIRFAQAGYRLLWVGKARLYHLESRSTGGTDSPLRRYYLARSSILFFRRHGHLGRPLLILLFRLGSAIKMLARLLLLGKRDSARAYWRGMRDGWKLAGEGDYQGTTE